MRTKLFLAFILIILLALLSNLLFERFIIKDFDNFIKGTDEDHIYWIMASVEGSYRNGQWDTSSLDQAIHWGVMLGFETYVEDISGRRILSSDEVLASMDPSMMNKMNLLLKKPAGAGEFMWYPLYVEGLEIGKLYLRPTKKTNSLLQKEDIFRNRGKEFLISSFLIAGGGALVLSVLFTIFLSYPVRRLKKSAEQIAKGDFSAEALEVHKTFKDEFDSLTESFNYMAEALRREESLRKHLTSNIAHELRTPLTVIRGNLEAIEDGVISDPHKVIRNIKTEIQRIISLVEGIDDITSAQASFFRKGDMEEIDLKEFIESATGGMRELIEEKGLFLKMDGPSIKVKTYPEKLHIIMKNLLTNAYKFTSKGGITINWDKQRKEVGMGFYVSVEDTGKGISIEERPKVFDRFYKERTSGGKGLGLAIVKELAEIMGGEIELESIHDKGTRVRVDF